MPPASCCLLFYAMYLTFSEHVHGFISLYNSTRRLERKEAHPELDQPFDEAVILLDEVVRYFLCILGQDMVDTYWHSPLAEPYKLSLRDIAEMFLERGFTFTHEAIRDWEARSLR